MSDYLCEELIVEIFTRLPPKSLLRFRSVSKWLCSCIGSPSFIRLHTYRSSSQKVLIRHKNDFDEDFFYTVHSEDQLPLCHIRGYDEMPAIKFPFKKFGIVGSCKGLVCAFEDGIGISLWNPSIRRKLTLPHISTWRYSFCDVVAIGFGFDPITDDYKIVWISESNGVKRSHVYAIKTGVWCEIASPATLCFSRSYVRQPRGSFVDGNLHWIVELFPTKLNDPDIVYILTFDLSNHVFSEISLPGPNSKWETRKLRIMNGSLAVISMRRRYGRIWVRRRKDNNNSASWSLVLKLKMSEFDDVAIWRVFLLTTNGDILFDAFRDGNFDGFYAYNPQKQALSRLVEFNASSCKVFDMEMFVESLELLDKGTTACE